MGKKQQISFKLEKNYLSLRLIENGATERVHGDKAQIKGFISEGLWDTPYQKE